MRNGLDDVWGRLAFGEWLAHERRMQLLDIAAQLRLVTQLEAGASKKRNWFDPITDALHGFRRLFPQHPAAARLLRSLKVK